LLTCDTGWLYDISDSYDNSFYVTGICLVISGLMLYPIPGIQRWQRSRSKNETATDRFTASSSNISYIKDNEEAQTAVNPSVADALMF